MSMEAKVVAYGCVSFDENNGNVIAERLYNCTVAPAGAGDGDFNVTIGQGGVDRTLCQIKICQTTSAVGGANSVRNASTIHTSDTVKRIQFRDDTGVIVSPTGLAWFEILRMPPLPVA